MARGGLRSLRSTFSTGYSPLPRSLVIILGIDPGTRAAGYGVIEVGPAGRRGKERALDYGVVKMPAKDDHTLRLRTLYDAVMEVIERYKPDECAVEMPFYGKNAQSMLKLGRAQAAVMLAAMHREIPVAQYAPTEIKKAVVGAGSAGKEQVWFMVKQQLGLTEDRGLDASDALATALCHAWRATSGPAAGAPKDWAAFIAANPGRVR